MIKDCICPNCGRVNNYYEDEVERDWTDSSPNYVSYHIHCNCGCRYEYTEWYKLFDTEIKKIHD